MQSFYFMCVLSYSFNKFRTVHSGNKKNIYISFRVCLLLQLKRSGYRDTVTRWHFLNFISQTSKQICIFFLYNSLHLETYLETWNLSTSTYEIYIYIYSFLYNVIFSIIKKIQECDKLAYSYYILVVFYLRSFVWTLI